MVSPDLRFFAPQVWASRLMPSVVPRVKIISHGWRAWMKLAARSRRGFESLRGPPAQLVNAAMHIGVVIFVEAAQRLDDGAGFCEVAALSR